MNKEEKKESPIELETVLCDAIEEKLDELNVDSFEYTNFVNPYNPDDKPSAGMMCYSDSKEVLYIEEHRVEIGTLLRDICEDRGMKPQG